MVLIQGMNMPTRKPVRPSSVSARERGDNVPPTALADFEEAEGEIPYQVGRGKPPLHSRFKPGGKGGPGRPKGAKNRATLLREALDTPRPVTIEGRRRRMSAQELGYRQLAMKIAKGDLKALGLAEQLRNSLCGPDEPAEAVVPPLTDAELAILRRLGHV